MKQSKRGISYNSVFINDIVSSGSDFYEQVSHIPTKDHATRLTLEALGDKLIEDQGLSMFEDDDFSVMFVDIDEEIE
ncbi:hypothetical protein CO180_03755 [candidate division WWE3 bacterium CG_4_9_14_3_um_filter_41_6]|uniref:Uncharacterized protein n=1 Tax=candidate division WWE3 bacterium CG_4_10_14_0_2_um_filter_41_14 TaxID=1975072 RepID=A0A2M7TFL0_UNCKA|nr:MAG: hypothetical protein COY32_06105 [candidate division WWE3 bacterium CG_4_10_14_0_2_um_filter_41_14]PJA38345.1 MAG: hypothetical protein CO180_03755 [candidate division WWE3 bacterium CG_4_9_14_3_um_filter_41_6]